MLIGELSQTCKCPAETIRYYEKIGLLPSAVRQPNGYRTYNDTHASILRFIVRAKRLGFTQDETRQLTQLAACQKSACADVFAILEKQHDVVREKIAELRKIEKALHQLKSQCCEGNLSECPVLDELMS